MSKVSFICAGSQKKRFHGRCSHRQDLSCVCKKALMFGIVLAALNLLPFPTTPILSNNTIVAEASETDTENVDSIRLNIKSEKTLITEETSTLRVYNLPEGYKVSFKSSDAEVVTAEKDKESNSTATLTGQGVGTANVTVTVKDGLWKVKSMKIKVVVGPPAQSVKFVESKIVLKIGERTTLCPTLKPSNTVEKGKFKSSDSAIASVATSTGLVIAKAVGTVTITVTIQNGATDVCTIEVVE